MKVLAVALLALAATPAFSQPSGSALPSLSSSGPSTSNVAVSPPAYIGTPQGATTKGTYSDADILTFAYNLEILEAQFYSCAAFGKPLDSSLLGGGPQVTTCNKANLSSAVGTYAAELATEETAHVTFLYNALKAAGASPVAPAVDITTAFEKAAEAAFGTTQPLNPYFNASGNDVFFLHASFIMEDLGTSAYVGASSLITSPAYLLSAVQIGATEAYHASLGRTLLYQIINTTPAYGMTVGQITSAIVAVINKVAGAPQIKYGLQNNSGSEIANVDSQGLTPAASIAQVGNVVTLGAPAGQGGGFFPNNLTGKIQH